eukprot:7410776-Pyramimonas_sp.AAC.1
MSSCALSERVEVDPRQNGVSSEWHAFWSLVIQGGAARSGEEDLYGLVSRGGLGRDGVIIGFTLLFYL